MNIRQLRAGNLVTTNGKPAGTTNGNVYKVLSTDSANRLDELKLIGGADVKYLHTLQNLVFDMTDLELDVENLISK